jgi:hypothetical protein
MRLGGEVSVALLYTTNTPSPSIPDAFAHDVTSRCVIDGLVRIDVAGRRRRERSTKESPCRQAAVVGLATVPIATVTATASAVRILVITRSPLLSFDENRTSNI